MRYTFKIENIIVNSNEPCCDGCFDTVSLWEKPTADLSCAFVSVPYLPPKPFEKSVRQKNIYSPVK